MTPVELIERLIADGIVDAVIQRVKTGKEAEVFVVQKGEEYFAAKVYKERHARSFKNNTGYMEGRNVRNTRDQRAMAKRTKYGVERSESEWMHTEHDCLVLVADAGVRVPKPELFYEGVLLMELVLDAEGQPAPRLVEVTITQEQAIEWHRELVGFIVRMLTCDLVHGDLSPFNVLAAWNGPTIIDLPQAIKAAHNTQAEQFLVRDVRNITEHFARFAPELKRRVNDGYRIWQKYMRRELTPDYFPREPTEQEQRELAARSAEHTARAEQSVRAMRDAARQEDREEGRPQGRRVFEAGARAAHRGPSGRPPQDRPSQERPPAGRGADRPPRAPFPRPEGAPAPRPDRPRRPEGQSRPGGAAPNAQARPDRPRRPEGQSRPGGPPPNAQGRPDRPRRPEGQGRPGGPPREPGAQRPRGGDSRFNRPRRDS